MASKGLVNLILGHRLTSYCCRFEGKINREHMIYGKFIEYIELHTHGNCVSLLNSCDCGSHLVPVIALMIDGLRRNMCADVESWAWQSLRPPDYVKLIFLYTTRYLLRLLNICVYQYPSLIHQICQQGDNYYNLIQDQFRFADKAIYSCSIVSEEFVIAGVSSNVITG